MKRIILTITVALLLSGCSIFKKYSRPESITTDALFGRDVIATDSTSIADIGWRDFFTDPHLQTLIEQGLKNNSDMLIAAQRVTEAEAALRTARLSFLPSFAFSPSFSTSCNIGQPASYSYSLPISAGWEIDIAGRTLNNKRKANAAYEQSKLYRRSVQTSLIASIANCYYTLLMLDAQQNISRTTAESWKENVRITRAMKQAGMTNEASVSRTEANACSIEASLFDLEYDIIQVENSLALLLGVVPQHFERGLLHEQRLCEELLIGVPAQLLSRRPDVQSAERALEQAYYNANFARADMYPSLKLNGSIGWNPASWLVSFVANLATDIFNAGKKRAALTIAKAQQEETLITFRQTLLAAGNEVNDALAKCHAASNKTDVRMRQIAALESAVNSTRQLMSHSESTYLEVLTAQQALLSAQLSQVADRFERIQGTINLYKALGGGADEEPVEVQESAKKSRKAARRTKKAENTGNK